jgi:hypothetical protein
MINLTEHWVSVMLNGVESLSSTWRMSGELKPRANVAPSDIVGHP